MAVTRYEPIASYVGAGEFLGDAEECALGEFVLYSDYVELERERDELLARAEKAERDEARAALNLLAQWIQKTDPLGEDTLVPWDTAVIQLDRHLDDCHDVASLVAYALEYARDSGGEE